MRTIKGEAQTWDRFPDYSAAEVSLHRSGTGGFSCGVTRKLDSTASVLPGYSEKTRELVKGRKGRPGQWGRQREEDGPRGMRKESGQVEKPGAWTVAQDHVLGPLSWIYGFCKLQMLLVQGIWFYRDELICRGEPMGWTERHKTKEREVKLAPLYTKATKSGLEREDSRMNE